MEKASPMLSRLCSWTPSHIAQFPQDCFRNIDKVHGEFCRNPFYRMRCLVHWLQLPKESPLLPWKGE